MTRLNMGILPAPTGDHGYRLSSSAVLGIATLPNTPSIAGCRLLGRFPAVSLLRLGICRTPGASCDAVGAQEAGYVSSITVARWATRESIPTNRTGGNQVGQLPAWTTIVSDHLMDVHIAVTRLALRDGVIDEHEQAVIETIQAAQGGVGNVHDEIAIVAAVVTRGRIPEYLKPRVIELFGTDDSEHAELTG